MSTRGAIVRFTGDNTFTGVYHHWDSYPDGLGKTLFNLRRNFFHNDTEAMLKVLIDEHPAGWSTINNKDFNLEPGFNELSNSKTDATKEKRPECYCHGDRHEPATTINERSIKTSWCAYAYAFKDNVMTVFYVEYLKGLKKLADIDLNGKEPKWETIS
jgi:hypothetical protein